MALFAKDFDKFSQYVPIYSDFSKGNWDNGTFFDSGYYSYNNNQTSFFREKWLEGPIIGIAIKEVLISNPYIFDTPESKIARVLFEFENSQYILRMCMREISGDWYVSIIGHDCEFVITQPER